MIATFATTAFENGCPEVSLAGRLQRTQTVPGGLLSHPSQHQHFTHPLTVGPCVCTVVGQGWCWRVAVGQSPPERPAADPSSSSSQALPAGMAGRSCKGSFPLLSRGQGIISLPNTSCCPVPRSGV